MVQLNPVPVFGVPPPPPKKKKKQYHLMENFHRNFRTMVGAQGKSSILTGMVWDTNMAAVLLF